MHTAPFSASTAAPGSVVVHIQAAAVADTPAAVDCTASQSCCNPVAQVLRSGSLSTEAICHQRGARRSWELLRVVAAPGASS